MSAARNRTAALIGIAIAILAAPGCGGGGSESSSTTNSEAPTVSTRAEAPVDPTLRVESPGVHKGVIGARYQCGEGSIWFPLKWSPAPPGTKALVLYIGRYDHKGPGGKLRASYAFIAANMPPHSTGVNVLPPNLYILVHNRLHSCAPRRNGQHILVQLYALPRPLEGPAETPSETAVTEIAEAALGIDPSAATSKWVAELTEEALASGGFTATYGTRKSG